jgi:hypothetical protein
MLFLDLLKYLPGQRAEMFEKNHTNFDLTVRLSTLQNALENRLARLKTRPLFYSIV